MSDAPIDAQARQRALDPTGSFTVSAPAGSGKTGLLTQRVLALLARVENPEEVLAITFTNKAAREMQERILAALDSAQRDPQPEADHARQTWQAARDVLAQDAHHGWHLARNPQRLRVQTIDGLCRAIALQLPFNSNLGAMPDTLEDARTAYQDAARDFLLSFSDDHPYAADFRHLYRHLDNNLEKLQGLFVSLLHKREQWLKPILLAGREGARHQLEQALNDAVTEHLQSLKASLWRSESELCSLADRAGANLAEDDPDAPLAALAGLKALPEPAPDALPQWRLLSQLLLKKDGDYRKRLTKREGFPAGAAGKALKADFAAAVEALEVDPDIRALLAEVTVLPPVHYNDDQWQLLDSLTRLLPLLAAQLRVTFQALGATDFNEITQAALEALGEPDEPTDLALKLDYRIRHILVDEFQDTALPQLQLLERLTAGWEPGDGRTLFIVGDGMQSCYGFRNANVGLFLNARRAGIGPIELAPEDLEVNFRSDDTVVRWVNDTFREAFPARDDISRGAVAYSDSIAFRGGGHERAVTLELCSHGGRDPEDDQPDSDTARRLEANAACERARQALTKDPDGTVAILARNRNHLREVLRELGERGIRYQANAIDSLASRMVIQDLMSLTRAVLRPDDRIAWLAILRARWCGLDLNDLHRLVTADLGEQSPPVDRGRYPFIHRQLALADQIDGLSSAGRDILQRIRPPLEAALASAGRKSLRQRVSGLWARLGGPATALDPADHEDCHQFWDLLERHERAGDIQDWDAFERAIESLYAAPMADADPRLQVMTLHKSKGLEFDTVIIPGLDRSSSADDKQLLLWRERLSANGEAQLMLGPLSPAGSDPSALYGYLQHEKRQQDEYEATRLLYVGCTRAAKRLHLLGCVNQKPDQALTDTKPGGLLARIWPQVRHQAQAPEVPLTRGAAARRAQPVDFTLRLPGDWRSPEWPDNPQLAHLRGQEMAEDETNRPERESLQSRHARQAGTLIHAILETLARRPLPDDPNRYIRERRPAWRALLRQKGLSGQTLNAACERAEQSIGNSLGTELGRWLLDHRHTDSAVELALVSRQRHGFARQVIDRTFRCRDLSGQWVRWIVDYKTEAPAEGQSPRAFHQQMMDEYRDQLERYRHLFKHEADPVRTALFFPAAPPEYQWLETTPAAE